jgi:hypothetical protein
MKEKLKMVHKAFKLDKENKWKTLSLHYFLEQIVKNFKSLKHISKILTIEQKINFLNSNNSLNL